MINTDAVRSFKELESPSKLRRSWEFETNRGEKFVVEMNISDVSEHAHKAHNINFDKVLFVDVAAYDENDVLWARHECNPTTYRLETQTYKGYQINYDWYLEANEVNTEKLLNEIIRLAA